MDMQTIDSNMIDAVGYDPETQELHIRFKTNGVTHIYQDVPPEKFQGLLSAKSAGKYFHGHIKSHVSRKAH